MVTLRSIVRPPVSRRRRMHVGFERLCRVRDLRQRHGDVGVACRRPCVVADVERLAHGIDALVRLPELEARKACDVLARRLDDDVALDREALGRRPVEIAARSLDGLRLAPAPAPPSAARA